MEKDELVVIVGAGQGLSASLARLCNSIGMKVALASRNSNKLENIAQECDAKVYKCDVSQSDSVESLFRDISSQLGTPDLVIYNPSNRVRGSITDIKPIDVQKAIMITCFGGFLVGQQAAKLMVKRGSGSILFTGASASVKGYANSSAFAMGKFGLRGLAQSMARELQPKNIHVGHFVIDGGIGSEDDPRYDTRGEDGLLLPDKIAETYLHFHRQHRSAWAWEIELRPWVEKF